MTMYPAAADHSQNLMKKKKKNSSSSSLLQGGSNYGSRRDPTNCAGYNNNYNYDCLISLGVGGRSNVIMATEDESRTTAENISNSNEEKEEEEAIGSSFKVNNNHKPELIINNPEKDEGEAGWLQLSLGSSGHQISLTTPPPPPPRRRRLLELDLLPPPSASSSSGGETWSLTLTPPPPQLSFQIPEYQAPAFFLQPHKEGAAEAAPIDLVPGAMTFTHHQQQQYDNNSIPFRPPYPRQSMNTTSSLSLDRQPPPSASSSSRGSFHFHSVVEPPPLCMDLRVVDPPPRLHSGIWFILQASQNQTKQPYLPQVPKNYLRIKDDKTTVRLLIKYLVNKLKLDRELEIEVTCKGQQLLPFLTLQHVRDNIWNNPRRNDTVFPHVSATIDHLMVLNYGRIA